MTWVLRSFLLAGLVLALARSAPAQQPDSVTIVAGARYKAGGPLGWLARWAFGSRHRDLWATPVKVEAVVPDRWRGGITLIGADTGLRMGYLYYRDVGGEVWTFRAIDRDFTPIMPERFRRVAMSGFFQDLYSARHPAAPLVWPTMARAAGIGVPDERLVALMTDSVPIPGYLSQGVETRFREVLEDPGLAIPSSKLVELMGSPHPPAIDTLSYLRERLFDLFVGSWDPVPQEWLWIRRGARYAPLARERDGAFARFDGLVASLAATGWAELAEFGEDYTGKLPVTTRMRVLDRYLLTGVDPTLWIPAALELRARISDSVIDLAVAHMPREYLERSGPRLAQVLRSRRDRLPEAAQRFRLLIMEEADVYGTAGSDSVVADFEADSVVRIRIDDRFDRSFHAAETQAVRLYLQGGNDHLLFRGSGIYTPLVEVADDGNMTVFDSSLARGYDFDDDLRPPSFVDVPEAPLVRSTRYSFLPWLGFNSDLGLLVGGGVLQTTYDPASDPWRRRVSLRAGYATSPASFGVELSGEYHIPGSAMTLRVEAKASGLEILRYYGYGNETPRTEDRNFYRTDQQHLIFAPTLVIPMSSQITGEIGPIVKMVTTGLDGDNLLSDQQPYGVTEQGFGHAGVHAGLRFDSRDSPRAPSRGVHLRFATTAYPAVIDAEEAFGAVEGSASGAWTPLRPLTLAARVAGRTTWGKYPAHEAAYVGGSRTVRSLSSQRFAGDAAVWTNFDARLRLASLPFVMRWDFGVLGIADAGRVFLKDQSSRKWHNGFGGGLWMALPDRSFVVLADVVTGGDGTRFWAGTSFIF